MSHCSYQAGFCLVLNVLVMLGAWGSSTTWAQESPSAISIWQCLPEETAAAVRLPNGRAIAQAFVRNTKMGAVLFSEERRKLLFEGLEEIDSQPWSTLRTWQSEYGLTADDLLQILAGETGYAIVLMPGEDDNPLPLGAAWLQPGEELARRAYELIGRIVEDTEDEENPVRRVDMELADRPVMQLMVPSVEVEIGDGPQLPDNLDELSEEERDAAREAAFEEWENSRQAVVRYGTLMVSKIAGRLILVHGFETAETPDEHPDSEPLADLLARLLAEHSRGEGGFVEKHAAHPGLIRTRHFGGVVALDLVADVESLMGLARGSDDEPNTPASEIPEKMLRIMGLDSLGLFTLRSALQETTWRTDFSLAVPEPREGLMRWLNQTPIDPAPPAWVPANAVACSRIGFDLGRAYEMLEEELRREFPEQMDRFLNMANAQLSTLAQTSILELLNSVGDGHTMVDFGVDSAASSDIDLGPTNRFAVVWQLENEQVWSRLMKAMAPMIKTTAGADFTEEQGYSGFRIQNDNMVVALFLGNGNLVLTGGDQMLEIVLSSLNNPPQGDRSFRGGKIYQDAITMLEPRPSFSYQVVDGNRQVLQMLDWVVRMFEWEAQFESSAGDDDQAMTELIRSLLPTGKERQNMRGAAVTRVEVNEHGLYGTSVQEYPPPDGR